MLLFLLIALCDASKFYTFRHTFHFDFKGTFVHSIAYMSIARVVAEVQPCNVGYATSC